MTLGRPMTKKEIAEWEADLTAERDLSTLVEAAKIRKDAERFKLAMDKRAKMQAELEKIGGPSAGPATTETK